MQKNSKSKPHYFQFDPSDWCEVLVMEDKAAGKRFKEMILRLSKFEAPEGTAEAKMIAHVIEYSEMQRKRVLARWNKEEKEEAETPPPSPPPPPRMPPQPQRRMAPPRPKEKRPPELCDIYDFCDANHLPAPFGREWYDYQENKGWNTLRMSWQSALRGFCEKKMKTNQ